MALSQQRPCVRAQKGPTPSQFQAHTRQGRNPSRCRSLVAARAAAAAPATLAPETAAVESVVQQLGGFFAPPTVEQPTRDMLATGPFLTKAAGALPFKPRNLGHALQQFSGYQSKYVSVRVENVHVKLQSWDHAVDCLAEAEERRRPYWCSLIEQVQHPAWWPEGGHVPTYDQVIFGRGNASIGLHFDKDNACAGGSRRPVSTYLAIAEGRKLCLLLPPGQQLLPPGGDAELLLRPTAQLLRDVKEAGGHFFMLEDDGAAAGGSTCGFSATALFMPAGWWHWLVGLGDWHVVFGGSFYPEEQQR